ncbi:MAG: hypothetical protein A2X11_12655 [Bacteroidetes bacterium GWE2_42_24]|nr:MAG: hypothetical protein A2X11_12655 [Bacteroidetes bacterium GWE2_42_24]OFY30626.1 MAG: hypothetical protein A2X09_03905 [Bacteroidetes bacterium GWF2_43_11]
MIPLSGFSQFEKMLDELDDAETEMVDGKLVLRLFNAENGETVPDANVKIEGIGEFTSDMQGRVLFDIPADGRYAFEFSKQGFIKAIYPFEVIAGTIFYNRISVCPVLDFGTLRVVVEWARRPKDMDAHLVKEGDYHISYQNLHVSKDGVARLDRDDRDGFGPETITVKNIDEQASYTYFIKNYSDKNSPRSKDLSKSKAVVRVYGNNQLMHNWQITPDQRGTSWKVFVISNGRIQPVNEVNNMY